MTRRRTSKFQDDLPALAKVKSDSLIPNQQPTPINLLRSADCYQQKFLKFPDVAVLHSYPEFLYAILLESDPDITAFVPHPYHLRVNGRHYIPDFYIVRNQGPEVIEIASCGEMEAVLQKRVDAFFDWHGLAFRVVNDESVLEQESLALNWLPLLQVLANADQIGLETTALEYELYQRCLNLSPVLVGDLLQAGRREEQCLEEVALYRLIYRHRLQVDIHSAPLDFDTELIPWISHGASV